MKNLLLFIGMITLAAPSVFAADSDVVHLSQAEFLQKVTTNDEFLIVDVRSEAEYAAGHIDNAINIPHGDILADISVLEEYRDGDIVFYCRSGGRVKMVTDHIQVEEQQGNGVLFHLKGDMQAWQAAGNPTVN